jgi:sugar O-acyltransferase (sialic acid O-acetyltransferase NeuD family)
MKIIIIGAGAHARVIIDILIQNSSVEIVGILDSQLTINSKFYGIDVVGRQNNLNELKAQYDFSGGIVAIGDNYSRSLVVKEIIDQMPNFTFINAVSPFTSISPSHQMGCGNVIMAGNVINSDAEIKNHCILNTKSSLEHNSIMHDFSSLAAGVTTGGFVSIGTFSAIALGCVIFDRITIGDNVIVGSGSLVTKDLDSDFLYYGSPAKKISKRRLTDKFLK